MIFFLNKENDFMSLMDFVKLFVNFLLNYLVLHDLHASYHLAIFVCSHFPPPYSYLL